MMNNPIAPAPPIDGNQTPQHQQAYTPTTGYQPPSRRLPRPSNPSGAALPCTDPSASPFSRPQLQPPTRTVPTASWAGNGDRPSYGEIRNVHLQSSPQSERAPRLSTSTILVEKRIDLRSQLYLQTGHRNFPRRTYYSTSSIHSLTIMFSLRESYIDGSSHTLSKPAQSFRQQTLVQIPSPIAARQLSRPPMTHPLCLALRSYMLSVHSVSRLLHYRPSKDSSRGCCLICETPSGDQRSSRHSISNIATVPSSSRMMISFILDGC
jgi:hypothetical protein